MPSLRDGLCERDGASQRLRLRGLKVPQANSAFANLGDFSGSLKTTPIENHDPGSDAEPQNVDAMMRLASFQRQAIQDPPALWNIKPMRTHIRNQFCFSRILPEKVLCFFKETLVHRTIVFSTQGRKLLEFAPLFGVQLRWHFHDNSDAQVSANLGVHILHSMAAKAQFRSALRPGRDFQQRVPLEGRNLHFTSQRCSRE
jgi:hypothetical protein